jgi:hypothetical protein
VAQDKMVGIETTKTAEEVRLEEARDAVMEGGFA